MRLWSLHPSYLDSKGLVALWREGLLAQKVLQGQTRGYKNHPQLLRFKNTPDPLAAIATYLGHVADEADRRGYHFDRSKLADRLFTEKITVTNKQLDYEFSHLLNKLQYRDTQQHACIVGSKRIKPHPMLLKIKGDIEAWEVIDK